jgi:LCP family protein required for cell wall assembly
MTEKVEDKKLSKRNVILILAVLLISVVSLSGWYIYLQLNKINYVTITNSDEALGIKPELNNEEQLPLNVALFGVDQWDTEVGRSDVIMIVSIDKKYKKIRLSSIMRDTYVNIPGHGMDKINHAYAFGGPQLSINTINSNFNLDIKDFATIDFSNMEKVVDLCGGVDIDVSPEELSRIHGLEQAGVQHLNGEQAVDYMRIRYVGNGDYQRTERQRSVLTEIIYKIQAIGATDLPALVDEILPLVTTSFTKSDLLKIGADTFAANIRTVEKARFPMDSACEGTMIHGIYYLVADLNVNTNAMHDFIYNDKKYAGSD